MAKQLQWVWSAPMPGGQNLLIGDWRPEIDYGAFAGIWQSPYGRRTSASDRTPIGYQVPAGHALGLTTAWIDSKFAWRGNADLPTMRIKAHGEDYQLEPLDGEHNSIGLGIGASSYLVLSGAFALPDTEGCRHFDPPLIVPAGGWVQLVISNNHSAQTMNVGLQGLLAELTDSVFADEVFVR